MSRRDSRCVLWLAFSGLAASSLLCADRPADSDVIVRSAAGNIVYENIGCPKTLCDDRPRCLKIEQERLRIALAEKMIDAAVRLHRIELTAEETEFVERDALAERQASAKFEARMKTLWRGALRVRGGEDIDVVARELKTHRIDRDELDDTLAEHSTETLHELIGEDHWPEMLRVAREGLTRSRMYPKLRALVAQRAQASRRSLEEEAQVFWADVIRRTDTRLVSDRYQMPDFKGVLIFHGKATVQQPSH